MTTFNPHKWCIKWEIEQRVQRESLYDWATSKNDTYLPKVEIPKTKINPGVWNFIRNNVLKELRP